MRIFKTPPWAKPFRCECGGDIDLQPWETYVEQKKAYGHARTSSAIIGLNFICYRCMKQWKDYQGDWGTVIDNKEEFHKLYQERVVKKCHD